jgi:2-keto-3-deoxy-L-rhamnonate aldolase RhmA
VIVLSEQNRPLSSLWTTLLANPGIRCSQLTNFSFRATTLCMSESLNSERPSTSFVADIDSEDALPPAARTNAMRFFFITGSPDMALHVATSGVDRIFVDLELLGKEQRQGHLSTVISRHTFDDLAAVRAAVPNAIVMARLNPVHEGTRAEVERAVSIGANVLVLPMYRAFEEAEAFCNFVDGRAAVCLLAETMGAVDSLAEAASLPGVSEVHVGLNDLHLELGLAFMYEPIVNGLAAHIAQILRASGKPFGIGGLARLGEGVVPAELLLAEHVRLGSTAAILSRTFHRSARSVLELKAEMDVRGEIDRLRASHREWLSADPEELDRAHEAVCTLIEQEVARRRAGR